MGGLFLLVHLDTEISGDEDLLPESVTRVKSCALGDLSQVGPPHILPSRIVIISVIKHTALPMLLWLTMEQYKSLLLLIFNSQEKHTKQNETMLITFSP